MCEGCGFVGARPQEKSRLATSMQELIDTRTKWMRGRLMLGHRAALAICRRMQTESRPVLATELGFAGIVKSSREPSDT